MGHIAACAGAACVGHTAGKGGAGLCAVRGGGVGQPSSLCLPAACAAALSLVAVHGKLGRLHWGEGGEPAHMAHMAGRWGGAVCTMGWDWSVPMVHVVGRGLKPDCLHCVGVMLDSPHGGGVGGGTHSVWLLGLWHVASGCPEVGLP